MYASDKSFQNLDMTISTLVGYLTQIDKELVSAQSIFNIPDTFGGLKWQTNHLRHL